MLRNCNCYFAGGQYKFAANSKDRRRLDFVPVGIPPAHYWVKGFSTAMYSFIPHDPKSPLHAGHVSSHKVGLAFELHGHQGNDHQSLMRFLSEDPHAQRQIGSIVQPLLQNFAQAQNRYAVNHGLTVAPHFVPEPQLRKGKEGETKTKPRDITSGIPSGRREIPDFEDSQPGLGVAVWHGKPYAVLTAPIVSIGSVVTDFRGAYRAKKWSPMQHLDLKTFPVHAAGAIGLSGSPQIFPNAKGGIIQPTGPIQKVSTQAMPPMSKNFSFGFKDSQLMLKMKLPYDSLEIGGGAQLQGTGLSNLSVVPKASAKWEHKGEGALSGGMKISMKDYKLGESYVYVKWDDQFGERKVNFFVATGNLGPQNAIGLKFLMGF